MKSCKFFKIVPIRFCFLLITGGGGSPDTNAYLRAKLKVSVFENGQFSGHLIFDKKTFFSEKKFFYPDKQELWFFEKKQCSFFWKKIFFLEMFFRKNFKKILTNFLWAEKFWKFWKQIFEKTFLKKRFFFKKMNIVFFQKNKVLVYRGKNIFSPKKKFFCQKLSVR